MTCPLNCGDTYLFSQKQEHLQKFCTKYTVNCPFNCGDELPLCSMNDHFLMCPLRVVIYAKCDDKMKFADFEKHFTDTHADITKENLIILRRINELEKKIKKTKMPNNH